MCDIIINFRSAWFDAEGRQVFNAGQAAKQYFKMWFWIDIVSTVPWDMFELAFPDSGARGSAGTALKVMPLALRAHYSSSA